jgi:hypothetical protein
MIDIFPQLRRSSMISKALLRNYMHLPDSEVACILSPNMRLFQFQNMLLFSNEIVVNELGNW